MQGRILPQSRKPTDLSYGKCFAAFWVPEQCSKVLGSKLSASLDSCIQLELKNQIVTNLMEPCTMMDAAQHAGSGDCTEMDEQWTMCAAIAQWRD